MKPFCVFIRLCRSGEEKPVIIKVTYWSIVRQLSVLSERNFMTVDLWELCLAFIRTVRQQFTAGEHKRVYREIWRLKQAGKMNWQISFNSLIHEFHHPTSPIKCWGVGGKKLHYMLKDLYLYTTILHSRLHPLFAGQPGNEALVTTTLKYYVTSSWSRMGAKGPGYFQKKKMFKKLSDTQINSYA